MAPEATPLTAKNQPYDRSTIVRARFSDGAEGLPEDLTATLMTSLQRGILILLGVHFCAMIPLLSPNKAAAAWMSSVVAIVMLVVPYLLLRVGQTLLAARVCLAGGALIATIIALFGRGGMNNAAPVFQVAMAGLAIVILGRRWGLWIAVFCLTADLANALAEFLGHPLPIVFHNAPLSTWVFVAAVFTILLFPLNSAVRILQNQLAELARTEAMEAASEEELRRSQYMLEEAQRTARVGSWDSDPITGKVAWSKEMYRIAEIDPAHGRALSDVSLAVTHPDDRASVKKMIEDLRRGVEHVELEHRLLMPDGRIKFVWVQGGVTLIEGRPRLYGTVQDVTDRNELERRLAHAEKMESIGRLAGGVAHDFNNMLTVILGYSAMLKGEFAPGSKELMRLAEIEKAANRSKDITRQLLGFSRQQIIAPAPSNLNHLVTDLTEPLGRLIGEDIELSFFPGDELWTVVVDSSQVNQLVLNLAVNARDAMPAGGKLSIETKNVTISKEYCRTNAEALPGNFVVLAVSDTGVGIAPEIISRIFEPFFTTKGKDEGTGLGLSMVYGIAKQNGGFVSVYSEPGHGTTFRVYIPRITGEKFAVDERNGEAAVTAGSGKVLVVEDDELVRGLVTSSLESIGYTPLVAASPAQALKLCSSPAGSEIRLVLTDVVMPGMNGMELRDRICAVNPGMRVLFMSGYTSNVIVKHGILKPGVRLIQKPFTTEDLSRRIEEVLTQP